MISSLVSQFIHSLLLCLIFTSLYVGQSCPVLSTGNYQQQTTADNSPLSFIDDHSLVSQFIRSLLLCFIFTSLYICWSCPVFSG